MLTATVPAGGAGDPLVPNLVLQFSRLDLHGDPIGVNLGVGVDPDMCRHYQGVIRNQGAGTPYLFLTRSGQRGSGFCGTSDNPAELCVAKMASRGTDGERMRSNKLKTGSRFEDTAPPSEDTIVWHHLFNGSGGWPAWTHAGGTQMIDGVLPIPLERPVGDAGSESRGTICFVDVSNPESPTVLKTLPEYGFNIGVMAVSKDPTTGLYLFMLTGGNSETLRFYESNTADLRDANLSLTPVAVWLKSQASQTTQDKWMKWQTMNFVRDSGGGLYLICMDNATDLLTDGDDWVRLFSYTRTGPAVTISYVAERHLRLSSPKMGDLDAAGGVYVSPSGQLILYTGEHDNDGADGSIRMGEFRNYNVNNAGTDTCWGWVELYEDNNGWDTPGGRSFILDYRDRGLDNWSDLRDFEDHSGDLNGFSDATKAVRWAIPSGRTAALYADENYTGNKITLVGDGSVHFMNNVNNTISVTSVRFEGNLGGDRDQVWVAVNSPNQTCSLLPGGLGVQACPFYGSNGITLGLNALAPTGCVQNPLMFLSAGTYNQQLTIGKKVTLQTTGGLVRIGGP
ncbi:MAG: hypothetical protein HRF43_03440 [Phycisphaerae bacterium]